MAADGHTQSAAGEQLPRRLFFYNAGFLRQRHLRRMLTLAGHSLHLGLPGPDDGVVVWGRSRFAARGEAMAASRNVPLIRLEDAFLRGLRPGRTGEPGLGLLIDGSGVHFDSSAPSALERLLFTAGLDDSNLLTRARDGMARLSYLHLSKYNMHPVPGPLPAPGYVLVVDQTRGDASIRYGGASEATFREMLVLAQEENPGARVVIKAHPETKAGFRPGHFIGADAKGHVSLLTEAVSPRALLEGAIAVYTVSSQLGFEAILSGHRPVVLGQPFYAGWGLSDDRNPVPGRHRKLTRAQMFASAMILAPTWVDPCRDRLCSFEQAVDQLEADVRAFREDRSGHVATGMRLWKRRRMQDMFGREVPLVFRNNPAAAAQLAQATGKTLIAWGTAAATTPGTLRVEDGFLRSRGLGAKLVPPLSLVLDDLGIYYDASRESRLERLIQSPLPPGGEARADALRHHLIAARVSKYNLAEPVRPAPPEPSDPSDTENLAGTASLEGTGSLSGTSGPASTRILAGATLVFSTNTPAITGNPPGTDRRGPSPNTEPPPLRILVAGQVEDDASILLGGGDVRTNLGLLQAARAAHPGAVILYKPHPDVEAGLRPGKITAKALTGLADFLAEAADPLTLIAEVDQVWTMTSLLGFEALIRGKPVTTLGAPFYAGWGLTRDLGPVPVRRHHAPDGHPLPRPSLNHLIHAALIAYPRYYDPVSRRPCPPEVVLERLASGTVPHPRAGLRALSKLQGLLASQAWLWR